MGFEVILFSGLLLSARMDMEMHSLSPINSRPGSVGRDGKVPISSTKNSRDSRERDAYELSRVGKKDVLKVRCSIWLRRSQMANTSSYM